MMKLCENPFMLRVPSARTGCAATEIEFFTVRPELRRRAPIEFLHTNQAEELILLKTTWL